MGGGSKFDSALSTRGGKLNFVTSDKISIGDLLATDILDEMSKNGIKFTKEKIVFAARLDNGEHIFLENDRVEHIIERHIQDFESAFGIKSNQLVALLSDTISKGKLISAKFNARDGKTFYRNKYYYQGKYCVVYGIAENGYIETAYPASYGGI